MSKFYLHTPTESSERPLKALKERMEEENMIGGLHKSRFHIIPGDRKGALRRTIKYFTRTRNYCLDHRIIHLWAGENSSGTEDEKHRAAITCLSDYQLCTNEAAKENAANILKAAGREPRAYVVGNIMLDCLDVNDSWARANEYPEKEYDLILINPETGKKVQGFSNLRLAKAAATNAAMENAIWIEPNDDPGAESIRPFCTHERFERPKYLALIKYCRRFITNSSSAFYEAQHLMDEENIVIVGERNRKRVSRDSDMSIEGAIDRTIEVLKEIADDQE